MEGKSSTALSSSHRGRRSGERGLNRQQQGSVEKTSMPAFLELTGYFMETVWGRQVCVGKKRTLVVDGGGGRRWSGASSGAGAESGRKTYLLLGMGGGQPLETLLRKLKWRCLMD